MGDPIDIAWPVPAMTSTRLTIRPSEARDRPHRIELLCSPEVRRFLGGPVDRALAETETREVAMARPGVFAVEQGGRFLGTVMIDRRFASRPGHISPDGGELEISYTFLPEGWGMGFASEAVETVLQWCGAVLPGEPVVLCTQVANTASVKLAERLGFAEVQRFEEFGADQWFGVRTP